MITTLIDGMESTSVEAADRGLMYGDGLFETLRIRQGQPSFWHAHMARLASGCMRLGIAGVDEKRLRQDAERLAAQVSDGVLKIVVTRGSGDRGYRPSAKAKPTHIVQLHSHPDYPEHFAAAGVNARVCSTRLGRNPVLAGMKHLNRLEQVLARAEWHDPAVPEAVMLDTFGLVVAGTMSNLFFVQDEVLCTPDLAECGVAGVTRQRILEWARHEGVNARIARYTLEDLLASDEIFFCNSLIGVWPVRSLENKTWQRGPLTARVCEMIGNTSAIDA